METTISEGAGTRKRGKLPAWLQGFNRVVMALQRLGFVIGTMHVLSVPGRQSGVLRSTPVSLLTVDGQRYIVAGLDGADWVLNARVAGRGMLHRGRTEEHVSLIELPVEERARILGEFPAWFRKASRSSPDSTESLLIRRNSRRWRRRARSSVSSGGEERF
ncbi:MAG TPA: hypothetical protein VHG52_02775 [Thermomicrobiales bacterium]|nr:hypothetical protein [Thermomicrobiales bacterium]